MSLNDTLYLKKTNSSGLLINEGKYTIVNGDTLRLWYKEYYMTQRHNIKTFCYDTMCTFYDTMGIKKSMYQTERGIAHGKFLMYDEFGNVIRLNEYQNGKRQGKEITYDSEGRILLYGHYQNNKPEGYFTKLENGQDTVWKALYSDSSLVHIINYQHNVIVDTTVPNQGTIPLQEFLNETYNQ